MALYAIGDLHLSFSVNKPMNVFGPAWENHEAKLQEAFSRLNDDDVCVLCGDSSWGMNLDEALADFRFIDALPGKKIVLKGNHDYWWATRTKLADFFEKNSITTIDVLNNNCFFYEGAAICGTRGWFYEEESGSEHDRKILNRELMRLEASLKAAGSCEKYCFLHYPPKYNQYECVEILDMLAGYGVKECISGHIHGLGHRFVFQGNYHGTLHRMVSADYVKFVPVKILS